jgi:predicted Zn-dependent peptidase
MKQFKLIFFSFTIISLVLTSCTCNDKKPSTEYESVANDPLNTRIYTLDNGLKVYMSVYKDAPRIQTYIAVGAGSKNDPKDATGLAHYLEHMLFKGTDKFGTKDFAKEEPLVNAIDSLFEVYRKTTDTEQRKKLYHIIDSVSGVAAQFAIANEYDKLMSAIGAKGTNAYTWVEQTVYVNDIPSNQMKKWLEIEAERFRKPVMRLFHTELEAVYEEKNISLDSDDSKLWDAMLEGLFQKHTYGTQTTIGTVEHLKNPSLTEIKKYFDNNYIPNNMAICLSGDFNPDSAIVWIKNMFGSYQQKPKPEFVVAVEDEIKEPIVKEVVGPDAEVMALGFRFGGFASRDAEMITVIDKLLYNNTAGLIDLNLNQQQKVLGGWTYPLIMKDYSAHIMGAEVKQGQTPEEAKDLLLSQLELIKKGDFPDWLLEAVINDMKLQELKSYESNRSRADKFVESFVLNVPWQDYVTRTEKLAKITKKELVDFANANYKNNYVVVYKRTGEDKNVQKVEKPQITPVEVNRESQSEFVKTILDQTVPDIEPVFLNYKEDIKTVTLNHNIPSAIQKE